MIRIKQVRLLLNGRYRDGSKASFELGFKPARYAIILFAALSLPSFRYHIKRIGNTCFASYYNLYKVAKILGLQYERNRVARNTYDKLASSGHVRTALKNNRTFITLTERGKRNCEEVLEDLQLLNEHFNSHPFLSHKYIVEEHLKGEVIKGAKVGSRRLKIEADVNRLIEKISYW